MQENDTSSVATPISTYRSQVGSGKPCFVSPSGENPSAFMNMLKDPKRYWE